MGPTIGKLDNRSSPVGLDQTVVTGIAIDLQDAGEALQNGVGILAATPRRLGEGHARRGCTAPRPIIAGQGPEVSGLGLASFWVKHRGAGVLRDLRGPTGATVPSDLQPQPQTDAAGSITSSTRGRCFGSEPRLAARGLETVGLGVTSHVSSSAMISMGKG